MLWMMVERSISAPVMQAGLSLLLTGNDIITIGAIGEIVRDLPLAKNRLRERF